MNTDGELVYVSQKEAARLNKLEREKRNGIVEILPNRAERRAAARELRRRRKKAG